MTTPVSFFDTSDASSRRANDPLVPADSEMQGGEGFAVIWRNAQRARGELLGIWFVRLVSRLSTLSHADWFKLGAPALPSTEREKSTQAG
jgi:hypothetical protein